MNDHEAAFQARYESLNGSQRAAVDAIDGPVMVIAGPGTGKTSVLTMRIANILRQTDTDPSSILCLTFTESAAREMRRKLGRIIGDRASRVRFHTFHGYARDVIERHADSFPRIIGADVASEADRIALLEKAIDDGDYSLLRPVNSPYHYVRGIMSAVSDLKRDAISPEKLEAILADEERAIRGSPDLYHEKGRYAGGMKSIYMKALNGVAKNRELARAYRAYEEGMSVRRLYDYEDMLIELLRVFESDPGVLLEEQESALYILADEHQDANDAQNRILTVLASSDTGGNIFVVGDEKQAIYRFQGASLENFLSFKRVFPEARLIELEDNYRSRQEIIDAAHEVLAQVPSGGLSRPMLRAERRGGSTVETITYADTEVERERIALDLEGFLTSDEGGTAAILVRTNAEISLMAHALARRSLPVTSYADDDVLRDPVVAATVDLLRFLADPTRSDLAARVLFTAIAPVSFTSATEALRKSRDSRIPLADALRLSGDDARSFSETLERLARTAQHAPAAAFFADVSDALSVPRAALRSADGVVSLERLGRLFDEVKQFQAKRHDGTIGGFIAELDALMRHGASVRFSALPVERRVAVMTVHRAKGMEWDRVYIPNLVQGAWGGKRARRMFALPSQVTHAEDHDPDHDERRLLYVAMTRARDALILSRPRSLSDGTLAEPCPFIAHIPARDVAGERDVLIPTPVRAQAENAERILALFTEQGLNPTALNAYLSCPWKYFFRNLVRVPEMPEAYLSLGTAVHFALARAALAVKDGGALPEPRTVGMWAREKAGELPLSAQDAADIARRADETATRYAHERFPTWLEPLAVELTITEIPFTLPGGEVIMLRGAIDKIERDPGGAIRIVDYKTGTPKSMNEMLGLTKGSTGDIKRQLDFYRLLLERYRSGEYAPRSGLVEFVEERDNGTISGEEFPLSESDSAAIVPVITAVASEILSLSFLNRTCGDPECRYCPLRSSIVS